MIMTNQLLAELEMANKKIEEKDKEIERLNNIIFKTHKMIYDNYGVLDKYEIDILDDILTGKELKEGK